MTPLRPYQQRAFAGVHAKWSTGHQRVCLVAPTGSGKTVMGSALVQSARDHGESVLWVAHRTELVSQAGERLRAVFGHDAVGYIAPGAELQPYAPVQVATVQTLLARDHRPPAGLVVFDEAHHYVAEDWTQLAASYPQARTLGLTATPERQDGRPLGDLFSAIVVAASYSELLSAGHLVPCRVYQPPSSLGSDLACDPVEAYRRYAQGSRAFVFAGSVKMAQELAESFTAQGIPAEPITDKTKRGDRKDRLSRFADGTLRVLTNVYALTEGVDVPAARTVILARGCQHVGMYLQIAGRVLRPHPEKTDAILVDLTGATLKHGLPTEDRAFSLEGDGIRRTSVEPLRNCAQCGACIPSSQRTCPECGLTAETRAPKPPRIYDLELREVYAGADTPDDAKERELTRLRELAWGRGYSLSWVVREYRQLFGEAPQLGSVTTPEEQRAEYERLRRTQLEKGFKPGFVAVRWKEMFGRWPPREWARQPPEVTP